MFSFLLAVHCPSAHRKANSWRGATMPASAPVRVRSIVVHLHEIGAEQSLDANPGIGEIVEISDVDRVNGNACRSESSQCALRAIRQWRHLDPLNHVAAAALENSGMVAHAWKLPMIARD
jgi:hypothetical protein